MNQIRQLTDGEIGFRDVCPAPVPAPAGFAPDRGLRCPQAGVGSVLVGSAQAGVGISDPELHIRQYDRQSDSLTIEPCPASEQIGTRARLSASRQPEEEQPQAEGRSAAGPTTDDSGSESQVGDADPISPDLAGQLLQVLIIRSTTR